MLTKDKFPLAAEQRLTPGAETLRAAMGLMEHHQEQEHILEYAPIYTHTHSLTHSPTHTHTHTQLCASSATKQVFSVAVPCK